MIKVKSGRTIRRLARRSLTAAKTRNAVAIVAIALTTLLFTALFTITMSINDGIQQSNFRQVGGYAHGCFKYLSEEQFDKLCTDPLICQYGKRRTLGLAQQPPFQKIQTELSYCDENEAKWMWLDPVEGHLPREGTNEAATDTRVLSLLSIQPKLGQEFTVSFKIEEEEFTETFTLCGWWEHDPIIIASHILLPESRVTAILDELATPEEFRSELTGTCSMDVMLGSTLHIERDLCTILANHGYQNEGHSAGDNFVAIGVNWGYSGAQLVRSLDGGTAAALVAVLLLVILTGYLIINNVFRISVSNDIRRYGLLKTIGTTPRQLRRIVCHQALMLSVVGIPVGLLLGWLTGGKLVPVIIAKMNFGVSVISSKAAIFLVSALFALATVLLSCMHPARMAAKVSPIEALRYTEGGGKRKEKKNVGGVSLVSMAWANLGRSRAKTALTLTSLALSVVLLTMTFTFTNGFDMDKYLRDVPCDFQIADAGYFRANFGNTADLPRSAVEAAQARHGITDGGIVYGNAGAVLEFVSEDYFRTYHSRWSDAEALDSFVAFTEHDAEGNLAMSVQLYGMEQFAADKLTVIDGDLSKLYDPSGNYIAAVYGKDDYDRPKWDSHWAKVGDTVTLRYVERFAYYDPDTGEIYPDNVDLNTVESWRERTAEYREVSYTVAALVNIPNSLNYRYYGTDEFILSDSAFLRDTDSESILYYAFDLADDADPQEMESFLRHYTEEVNSVLDYESKISKSGEFEGFRAMFLLLGGALSLIVGLVSVLNFFNTVLTGIVARRREFAVLQAIGMTGQQLKRMLVYEGLFYAFGAAVFSAMLTFVLAPLAADMLEGMFWFYSYRLTLMPLAVVMPVFLLLGVCIPLGVYRTAAKRSVVERLREAEA